jgi:uncharacterized protein with PIN domain
MIVDSSALVAILTSEPERELFLRVMSKAPNPKKSEKGTAEPPAVPD